MTDTVGGAGRTGASRTDAVDGDPRGGTARVQEALTRLLDEYPPGSTDSVEFWGAQFDAGLAWVHFPEGHGGLGLARSLTGAILAQLRDAGAPLSNLSRNIIGYGMGAPTLVAHGTQDQLDRHLRPLFTAEEIWCQLFSEPGAGSDVAGLASRAVRDGDEWVINGQKVWTTLAHTARWGMLVARTDPDVPKHQGLSYFIVDMDQPGVEVRPLRQITGEAEFNEVYFTDARVPASGIVGAPGDGWRVAITTLMHERVSIGSAPMPRGGGAIAEAVHAWHRSGAEDPIKRDRLLKLWIAAETARLTNQRAAAGARTGIPGPEGSTGKLQWAELNKEIAEFTLELIGAEGLLYPSSYAFRTPDRALTEPGNVQKAFLRSRANSIEGGTSEVMRNILGERVLGLPPEPRVDKDVAWKDVPRS